MNITVDLHDYTEVKHDLSAEQRAALAEALDVPAEDVEDAFCRVAGKRLAAARPTNIHLVNGAEDSAPTVFSLFQNDWWTQGYVGVLRFPLDEERTVTVNIHSRFDTDQDSRFLMYVFEKAFNAKGKIYEEMKIQGHRESTWDYLLMLLFIRQLHDAMKKGMYRQYREYLYNDANVRGRIDVTRHIRENMMLSNGKIAYTTREYTVDNMVNVLLLKAYACMEKRYPAQLRRLVAQDETVKKGLAFLRAEVGEWQGFSNRQILKATDKKIVQSVYKNYEPLRRTAVAVLKRLGINSFADGEQATSGLLIDMPRLWEEFLHNTIFAEITGQKGSEYKQESYKIIGGARELKPDFLLKKQRIVLDAKYKSHWGDTLSEKGAWEHARQDVFQILAYMGVLNCLCGGVIFPVRESAATVQKIDLIEENLWPGRKFLRIPYAIPQTESAEAFYMALEQRAQEIIVHLQRLIAGMEQTSEKTG